MPTYQFECDNCGQKEEFYQSIRDELPAECPRCRGPYRQLYSVGFAWVRPEVTTVGQVAEQNEKRRGKEQTQMLIDKYDPAPQKVWWRGDEPLDLKTVEDVQHYVATGEKKLPGPIEIRSES